MAYLGRRWRRRLTASKREMQRTGKVGRRRRRLVGRKKFEEHISAFQQKSMVLEELPDVQAVPTLQPVNETIQPNLFNIDQTIHLGSDWTVKEKLGQGSFGTIYRVENPFGISKVWKTISPDSPFLKQKGGRQILLDALREEAKITAVFAGHSNVVEVHDIVETGKGAIIVEYGYVKGPTISNFVMSHIRRGKLVPTEVSAFLIQRGSRTYAYAHNKKGIAHRDIGPSNIMIHESGDIKIIDWGLALDRYKGHVVGTPDTIAPEVILTPKHMKQKDYFIADVFSFATVIRHILTGINPLQIRKREKGKTIWQQRCEFRLDKLLPAHEICEDIPESLSSIVEKGMQENPEERISMTDMYKLIGGGYLFNGMISTGGSAEGMTNEALESYLEIYKKNIVPRCVLKNHHLRKIVRGSKRRLCEQIGGKNIEDSNLIDETDYVYGNLTRPFESAYGVGKVKYALQCYFKEYIKAELQDELRKTKDPRKKEILNQRYRIDIENIDRIPLKDIEDALKSDIRAGGPHTPAQVRERFNIKKFNLIQEYIPQYIK